MAKTTTPKYRMEVHTNIGGFGPSAWSGRATEKLLAAKVMAQNVSFLPGGCNEHVGRRAGIVPYIYRASIIEQRTGRVVATWSAPAFQVL